MIEDECHRERNANGVPADLGHLTPTAALGSEPVSLAARRGRGPESNPTSRSGHMAEAGTGTGTQAAWL